MSSRAYAAFEVVRYKTLTGLSQDTLISRLVCLLRNLASPRWCGHCSTCYLYEVCLGQNWIQRKPAPRGRTWPTSLVEAGGLGLCYFFCGRNYRRAGITEQV